MLHTTRPMTAALCACAALCALTLAPREAIAGEALDPTPYKNIEHGFTICKPQGWVTSPASPGEKTKVVGFQSDAASKGWTYVSPEMVILFFPRKLEGETDEKSGEVVRRFSGQPENFKKWAEENFRDASVKAQDFVPAKAFPKGAVQYQLSIAPEGNGLAISIPTPTASGDIVLVYYCNRKEMEKLKPKVFVPSFQSFRWNDKVKAEGDKADADLEKKLGDSKDPVDQRLLSVAREHKDDPGWKVFRSEHYVIVYNAREEIARKVIAQVESILPTYVKLFPPSDADVLKKIAPLVRVTNDKKLYHSYGGPPSSAGYWSPMQEELVFYDDGSKKADTTLDVLRHEAFHQYIFYSCGKVAPHSWFNEGYGDYFAGCEVKGGNFVEKPFDWRSGVIRGAVQTKQHVPIADIIRYEQSQYYANANLCYSEGWSIIYFLNRGPRSKVAAKFRPEWRKILGTYFETLKKEWGDPNERDEDELPPPDVGPPPEPTPPDAPGDGSKPGDPPKPGGDGGTKPGDPAKPADPTKPGDGGGATPSDPPKPVAPKRPRSFMGRYTDARKKAVDAAFEGVNLDEFEKVWIEFVKGNFN